MSEFQKTATNAARYSAPVMAVCGFSGSGKTTLLEAAIPMLMARGLTVAVVKHDTHGFVVDKEGKDSDRLFRAGATVALCGPEEQFFRRGVSALSLEAILSDLTRDHDLVLVEGHKDTPLTKVWLGNAEAEAPPDQVAEILEILPWNTDRPRIFLELVERWMAEAWRERPLIAGLLVGGKSSRMGRPKHLLKFGSGTLGEIAAFALSEGLAEYGGPTTTSGTQLNLNVAILGAGLMPHSLAGLTRLPDAPELAGPVAGLLAAHRWCPNAAWILTACDHPWLTSAEILWLAGQRRPGAWAILTRQQDGHPCPTLALYEPQALTILERSLLANGADKVRLAELFDHPHTVIGPRFNSATANVNTPGEFRDAQLVSANMQLQNADEPQKGRVDRKRRKQ